MPPGARPALHFTARSGWINDPLGLTYRDGTYHLYFQHVPDTTEWAHACHWGHATSPDLLHWTERQVALAPGDGDAGCWSGSVVTADDDETVLFYTAVDDPPDFLIGRVRTARPTDADLDGWVKDLQVSIELPAEVNATTLRDPYVIAEQGRWWMLVGAGLADGTATALGWVSDDLRNWRYSGPVASRRRDDTDPLWTGAMWECPQLLRVGDRHVLVVSVWEADVLHYVAAAVGWFAEGRFDAESWHRLTWGESYYAASAFRDRDGRPGLVFWLRGVGGDGWAGAISLPYLLELDDDRPVLVPRGELLALRAAPRPAAAVDVVWRPTATGELRLVDDAGAPVAILRRAGGRVTVDTGISVTAEMPCTGAVLRVVLDGPVVEVAGDAGLLAVPLPNASRSVRPDGPDVEWWSLGG